MDYYSSGVSLMNISFLKNSLVNFVKFICQENEQNGCLKNYFYDKVNAFLL